MASDKNTSRAWFITGSSTGFGRVLAEILLKRGERVAVTARNPDQIQDLVAGYKDTGLALALDVTQPQQIAAAVASAEKFFGRIDVLVNNAGMGDPADGHASVATIDALRHTFETNFFGAVAFTQELLPLLRAAEGARIVNVSSALGSLAINGDASSPFYHVKSLAYNASKAALNMFTVDLAYDLRETKVKVNSA